MPYFSFFPFIYTLEWSFQIYMLFDCPWILYTCWKTEASAWFYYSCIELVSNVIDWFYEYDWSLLVQIDFSFNRCCRRIEWVLVCELSYLLATFPALLCWFEAALLTVTSAGVFISRFLGIICKGNNPVSFFPCLRVKQELFFLFIGCKGRQYFCALLIARAINIFAFISVWLSTGICLFVCKGYLFQHWNSIKTIRVCVFWIVLKFTYHHVQSWM